jgi:hypothetical protein
MDRISTMNKTLVLALFALATATGAAAAAPANQTPDPEKKICKTERVTGSRTRTQRICMTAAEWQQLAARTAQNIDRYSSLQTSRRDGQTTQ